MITNILKKIATVFNRTACAMEMRVARNLKNIELSERHLLSLKAENDAFRDVVFNLEEEMNAKNIEIVDLNEKADHPTRHKIEACIQDMITQDRLPGVSPVQLVVLDNRVDDLENELNKLRGHMVSRSYQEFLAAEAAKTQTDDDRAKINDAIDRIEHASEVDLEHLDYFIMLDEALKCRVELEAQVEQLTEENGRLKLNDAIDEDDDEYIDPIERIMSEKPVGQFPPEDADTHEKRERAMHKIAALRRAELSSQTKGE